MPQKKKTTDRRLASSSADSRGGLAGGLTLLASGLGRLATQARWQVRGGRQRGMVASARQLVRKHPLRAVLLGAGLGYLLSRTKVG